jgi:hypothetical protein
MKNRQTTRRDLRRLYWIFAIGSVAALLVNPLASAGMATATVLLVRIAVTMSGQRDSHRKPKHLDKDFGRQFQSNPYALNEDTQIRKQKHDPESLCQAQDVASIRL